MTVPNCSTLVLSGAVCLASLMAAPPVRADDFISFQSPSGNIGCFIMAEADTYARCDIRDYRPSFANGAPGCDMDYGDAYVITASARVGQVLCHGDTAFDPEAAVLRYGQQVHLGGITCQSQKTSMTCTNARGAGFSLAKADQQVF